MKPYTKIQKQKLKTAFIYPLHFALVLQQSGQYDAALRWFQRFMIIKITYSMKK